MMDVKKVINRIYEFDLSRCELLDGDELVTTEHGNEFINTFVKRDLDNGIIVTPAGYSKGFVYKSANGGEIYNNPEWLPDIINFSLNLFGLKKGSFYRITVVGRNTRRFNRMIDITDDRAIEVINGDREMIIRHDFSAELSNTEVSGIFRAGSIEENLYFQVGKIYINNIIIDEIELGAEQEEEVIPDLNENTTEYDTGKVGLVAHGVYAVETIEATLKYNKIHRITGKGINLYFDTSSNTYILERDNIEDMISAPFTNANYVVEFNFNKAPYAQNYVITEVSTDISPNTLKQGYIKFQILDKDGNPHYYDRRGGRLAIFIKRIY